MIYVIIKQSHELGDPIDNQIDFISTSLEKAEEVWRKYYSTYSTINDSKWWHSADLREYPEDYFIYGLVNSKFKILKHVDNLKNDN